MSTEDATKATQATINTSPPVQKSTSNGGATKSSIKTAPQTTQLKLKSTEDQIKCKQPTTSDNRVQIIDNDKETQLKTATQRARKVMKYLSISEVILGSLCVLMGIVIAAIIQMERICKSDTFPSLCFSTGTFYEGLWCGVWPIIAGALGIRANRPGSTQIAVGIHIWMAKISVCFTLILFLLAIPLTMTASIRDSQATGPYALLLIFSFVAFVLQMKSAGWACWTVNQCCGEGRQCCQQPANGVPNKDVQKLARQQAAENLDNAV